MGIEQFIDNEVKANDVVLFMKGTPQFPMCGFSGQVVQILDHLGVAYKGINVLESDDIRNGIKSYSNWPTIPQLYVKGEFVGGCDIVREMFQAGELQQALKDKGVSVRQTRLSRISRVAKFFLFWRRSSIGALAALLVGVSGFLFGGGPESAHAGALGGRLYSLRP